MNAIDQETATLRQLWADLAAQVVNARPDLLDLAEVSRRLSISKRSVQTLVYSGELATVKIGRRRLVSAEALQDYLVRLARKSD